MGGHDGAYKGGVHVIIPFVGEKMGSYLIANSHTMCLCFGLGPGTTPLTHPFSVPMCAGPKLSLRLVSVKVVLVLFLWGGGGASTELTTLGGT